MSDGKTDETPQIPLSEPVDSRQKGNSPTTMILWLRNQRHMVETLYTRGLAIDAAQLLLEIVRTANDMEAGTTIWGWLSGELHHNN